VYCLGKCYAAPASNAFEHHPRADVHARESIVLKRIVQGGARTLQAYLSGGGYRALEQAWRMTPDDVIRQIEASLLRGRGGAGFPTARKWRAVQQQTAAEKFVVANADEGDPGAYIDRFIIEDDPHSLIEGMAIAAHAVDATRGYIYLRREYAAAYYLLENALAEARTTGFLRNEDGDGRRVFDIEVVLGHGSYVYGEETALLNSIEGRRPEVRPRPPYPTEQGLFGKPTLVNNVETLVNIPWIVQRGGDAYRALGFSQSHGTKVVSLNSLFHRPGLYEVEFGVTVRDIVEGLGGGLKTGAIKGVIIGGPLAGILPPSLLDTPFGFEELRRVGAMVGHGGIVAFDDRTSIAELIHHVAKFAADESCGKCTPCRLGSRRTEEIFERLAQLGRASGADKREWTGINAALLATSLCGLGTGLGEFAESALRHYGKELEACFA
jgi:NADH:ubiquinone oxidoreductase subunit F (NADH-binding)